MLLLYILGQDQHIGMKEEMNFDLDPAPQDFDNQFVGLTTPPRILKLDEGTFPSLEEHNRYTDKEDMNDMSIQNGYLPATPRGSRYVHQGIHQVGEENTA